MPLTPREKEVLKYLAEGKTLAEISPLIAMDFSIKGKGARIERTQQIAAKAIKKAIFYSDYFEREQRKKAEEEHLDKSKEDVKPFPGVTERLEQEIQIARDRRERDEEDERVHACGDPHCIVPHPASHKRRP